MGRLQQGQRQLHEQRWDSDDHVSRDGRVTTPQVAGGEEAGQGGAARGTTASAHVRGMRAGGSFPGSSVWVVVKTTRVGRVGSGCGISMDGGWAAAAGDGSSSAGGGARGEGHLGGGEGRGSPVKEREKEEKEKDKGAVQSSIGCRCGPC